MSSSAYRHVRRRFQGYAGCWKGIHGVSISLRPYELSKGRSRKMSGPNLAMITLMLDEKCPAFGKAVHCRQRLNLAKSDMCSYAGCHVPANKVQVSLDVFFRMSEQPLHGFEPWNVCSRQVGLCLLLVGVFRLFAAEFTVCCNS